MERLKPRAETAELAQYADGFAAWLGRLGYSPRTCEAQVALLRHLDYAVNNAGMSGRGRIEELAKDFVERVLAVNLAGVFWALQAELPEIEKNGGAIVNTSSVGGLVGVPGLSAYSASKWGVIGLTKSVALEYATRGVRINAIAPGSTATEMLMSGSQESRDFLISLAPVKRISEPIEIARAIVFLLADATYSTGTVLAADGGQSAP